MLERLYPNADVDTLLWLLKLDPAAASPFLHRLATWESNTVYKYPDRDSGGFIPDPRIKGTRRIAEAITKVRKLDYVQEAIKGFVDVSVKWTARFGSQIDFVKNARAWTDDDFKAAFPPRSKGDMVLRRTRFADCLSTWGDRMLEVLFNLAGLDYIRALITVWYIMGCGKEFEDQMIELLRLPLDVFDKAMGDLTNILKSSNHEQGWERYAELKCLTGYRLLPWPDYDPIEDTKALASGGMEKHMPGGFDAWAEKTLSINLATQEEFITYEEFIDSGKWITQGASSEGRLEVTLDGKVHRVKCRKNMLIDRFTTNELVEYSLGSDRMISTAFTKNELGKVRVAVCSDLATYLKMAYIVHVSGKGYLKWSHVTRNENAMTKIKRMRLMVTLLKMKMFGLPWDFKGFERQVKTEELISVYEQIVKAALLNVPTVARTEFDKICENVRRGFDNSVIIDMDGTELYVTGGLPSGLFLTSITGDGYNKTLFECATSIMQKLGMRQDTISHTAIQGDDTSLLHRLVSYLQLYDWIVSRIGAEAGTGKFGILYQQTEFLRVSFGPWGARGYPGRAVAGVVQRKPWSDSPFSEVSTISGAIEATQTCTRRGLAFDHVVEALIKHWSKTVNVDPDFVRCPSVCGGLGIGPPMLNVRCKGSKRVDLENYSVGLRTETRQKQWEMKASELGLVPAPGVTAKLAHEDAKATVISDEVKGISKEARRKWKEEIMNKPPRIFHLTPLIVRTSDFTLAAKRIFDFEYEFVTNKFGKWFRVELELNDLRRLGWIETGAELQARYPEYYNDLKSLSNLTKKDANMWLFGSLSAYTAEMNNTMTKRFTECVAEQVMLRSIPKGRLADIWYKLSLDINFYVRRIPEYEEILLW